MSRTAAWRAVALGETAPVASRHAAAPLMIYASHELQHRSLYWSKRRDLRTHTSNANDTLEHHPTVQRSVLCVRGKKGPRAGAKNPLLRKASTSCWTNRIRDTRPYNRCPAECSAAGSAAIGQKVAIALRFNPVCNGYSSRQEDVPSQLHLKGKKLQCSSSCQQSCAEQ